MKKLVIIFILLISCNVAFAETAKLYVKDGDYLDGVVIDATGFTHGVEMNTPGTAYLVNSKVMNAGTFLTGNGTDVSHGDGRGIVVTGAGAILYVTNTESMNNSEDGYRVNHGGKLILDTAIARGNTKNGFFVGTGGTMEMVNSSAMDNQYGFMGANGFLTAKISGSHFFENKGQGMQIIYGESVDIVDSYVYDNNTSEGISSGSFGPGNFGGISLYGMKKVIITDTEITNNFARGFFADSNSTYNDNPTRAHLERVKITGHGDDGIISRGDSVITIINSTLEGKCFEETDKGNDGTIGIITVDGKAVISTECP